jgi:2-polyprenyl-3-methyl-5-hydroxy-6-metoxy-1,4-benzoquinol methylase
LAFVGKAVSKADQMALYNDEQSYRAFAVAERSVPEVAVRHVRWLVEIQRAVGFLGAGPGASQRRPLLLDIGCGAGEFLAVAVAQGFEAYGLDISTVASQLAAEWHGVRVDVREIEEDPRDGFFDVVTLIGVLEHVLDPKSVLQHACRVLAAGGILFIYTPVWGMYDALASRAARATGGWFARPIDRRINTAHLQIFSKGALDAALRQLGAQVLTCEAVCEYNLPIGRYLQSLGVTAPRCESIVRGLVQFLIDRKLFFRNNMRVIAQKL